MSFIAKIGNNYIDNYCPPFLGVIRGCIVLVTYIDYKEREFSAVILKINDYSHDWKNGDYYNDFNLDELDIWNGSITLKNGV